MSPVFKILIGALMIVVGVFSSVTFWNELLTLVKAGVGPLLVLIGAFIVWLETDEWKLSREEKKQEAGATGLQREFQPEKAVSQEQETEEKPEPVMKYKELLSGTVGEVKDRVRDLEDPDYEALLKAEKQGKDRKTVKEFIERRID